ncbi:ATP-binding cassette domain-containing protein [candidate division KSB3 bacterium]|uniref:ATP-binding cassette domain-containing protein n=1 Tax=candidate division KSB3 bacterium TaxID=2044937 RepID=A0A9D5JY56_9BACT|nr:ATP-binding cassette domain-containing protein [candidate division KSB3 bacterium]MBD3325856.1 ATP-binding cassette domain-containing protein [candidate division KSB3 bacterium]
MDILLESQQLHKRYVLGKHNEHHVLKDVDLQIERGEFVSVMGPSGSGKSTLLYNISGMDRMTSGKVIFNGLELSTLSEEALSRVRLNNMGFIFQHIHLLKNLSVFDNIILTAYLAKNASRSAINQRAVDLMDKTGIAAIADHDITQASGGQLQRVGICRALINAPDIIFGDEPTGALNSKSSAEIMALLADINQAGTTILLVTHDVKVAAKTERVLFMIDGKIVAENRLGTYDGDHDGIKSREERLTTWLVEKGF